MLGLILTSLVTEGQELLWDLATTNDRGFFPADSEQLLTADREGKATLVERFYYPNVLLYR
ncbi:hypothetical protein IscW_ISCW014558 [Ixodes scapularis]|uniref:Uncharacterized protein n=1 Tax=Ixodes scapularis TaxID=6945 RepID=B7QIE7_IXOSC|nr:hypothetical protein IscW_ISCW014558 [Ixodes scapularis]|eukprot:XP_002414954.1 hypothetical protein IscW_ISCW014558 [Ixodes scapularis]